MTKIQPETEEQNQWFFLGYLHAMVSDFARQTNRSYEEADKIIRDNLMEQIKREMKVKDNV